MPPSIILHTVPSVDAFATPLGEVPVDDAHRQRLRELGLVGISDAPHAAEHSLEVQLPFLQVVLGEFERRDLAPAQPVELLEGGEVVQLEHSSSLELDKMGLA